jgi:hypothetical protein
MSHRGGINKTQKREVGKDLKIQTNIVPEAKK